MLPGVAKYSIADWASSSPLTSRMRFDSATCSRVGASGWGVVPVAHPEVVGDLVYGLGQRLDRVLQVLAAGAHGTSGPCFLNSLPDGSHIQHRVRFSGFGSGGTVDGAPRPPQRRGIVLCPRWLIHLHARGRGRRGRRWIVHRRAARHPPFHGRGCWGRSPPDLVDAWRPGGPLRRAEPTATGQHPRPGGPQDAVGADRLDPGLNRVRRNLG